MMMLDDPCTAYARAVVNGRIIAGPHVRDACRRHFRDLERAQQPNAPFWFDHQAADYVYGFFQDSLKLSEGQFEGVPFKLHPSQYFMLGSIFGWKRKNAEGVTVRRFRRAYIEMGKGNGKSPMVGGIGLFGLIADREPGAQIYSAGATYEQAAILFNDAVKMAQQSPDLWERITPTGNANILNLSVMGPPQNGSFFRPLSKQKSKTGSGPRPHFALCDELHEHPNGTIVDMLERGFKARLQPLLVMITNSGSDRKSICWEEHVHAIAVAAGEKEDDTLFSYVCALDEGDDPFNDPSCWIKANPLLGTILTKEYLATNVKQAKDLPSKQNNILRLHFCVWTDAVDAWLTRGVWEKAEDPNLRLGDMRGRRCWAALDLSKRRDMTCIGLVFEDGVMEVPHPDDPTKTTTKGKYCLFVKSYTPKDTLAKRAEEDKAPYDVWVRDGHLIAVPGPNVRFDIVANDLIEISRTYDLQMAAYDQWQVREFIQELEELGSPDLPLCDHPQGISRRNDSDLWMPGSIDAMEDMITEGRLRIAINPVLRSAVASTVFWKSPTDQRRFDKASAVARIDAAVAAAMACGLATLKEGDWISVYDLLAAQEAAGGSAYDAGEEIDYAILNNVNHPRHSEMLARFEMKQELEDLDA